MRSHTARPRNGGLRRRLLSRTAFTLAVLASAAGTASGQDVLLKVGDPAPPFTLRGSDGRLHSLSDHLGTRPVVLAWFPRVLATL
jgi:peroxiredoxin Q/BCP